MVIYSQEGSRKWRYNEKMMKYKSIKRLFKNLGSTGQWEFVTGSEEEKYVEKLMLACCKVYISETRNRAALETIEGAAKPFPEAAIVNSYKFEDRLTSYNRVGDTLVS
ncbi:hypothetical protein FH972_012397 [Carpinus fangiana]|uniref:Uncharacterized protein n=1 Tax=Carpinus fangiana TaxID=176857 RepID=A0A5N6R720_9ROSI|nr:hypothetical protein FH972_012397 [Carpinus fangiana]